LVARAVGNALAKRMAGARGDDGREAKSYYRRLKGP